jgi:hypothetical protein
MPQGEPQLEPVEPVVLPAEQTAVPLQPESVSPIAPPLGARAPEAAGMRDVMALTSPGERRRFVLQLQRTAGNAAVCRWLGVVRDRYAASGGGSGEDDEPDAPRER